MRLTRGFCFLLALLASIPLSARRQDPPADDSLAKMNAKLDVMLKQKEEKERKAQKERDALINKQPAKFRELIRKKQICIGMTPTQVTLAWGKPSDIHSTTFQSGVHEQWVYGRRDYVYFENGKVTAIQN